jgi:CubicO group peptidase (beta-lactamase class C family)
MISPKARTRGVLLGILLAGLAGQTFAAAPPAAGTADDQAEQLVRCEMARRNLPSVSLVVMKNGSIVKQAAYGYARLDPLVAATPSTRYRLDSLTKQFTAAGILVLQQQNRLRIGDPVVKYLPGAPASWKRVSLRDLLTHTAGFPRDAPSGYNDIDEQERSPETLLQRLYAIQPLTSPGWRYLYSNAGYAVLGAVIEAVSGQGYGQFLRQNLFAPAGMTSTWVDDQNYADPRLALGYAWEPASRRWLPRSQANSAAAAGSVQSTVLDLAAWEIALQGEMILSAQSKAQMWTTFPPADGDDYEYGLGWFVREGRAGREISHGGSGWGYSTAFHRYPDAGYTVIVLTNLQPGKNDYHGDAIADAIAAVYEPRLREPESTAPRRRTAVKPGQETTAPSGY